MERLDSKIQHSRRRRGRSTAKRCRAFRGDFERQFEELKAINRLSYTELERKLAASR